MASSHSSGPSRLAAILQALFVTFLWSTSWVLIRWGLEEMPALTFAGARYAIAGVLLAATALARTDARAALRRLTAGDWLRLLLLGFVFYTLTQGALFVALDHLPAVTLSLFLSFSPALVALLGIPVLGEHLSRPQWLGIAVYLAGTLIYFLPLSIRLQWLGLGAALVGLVANASAGLLGRGVMRQGALPSILVTAVSMGFGSLLLLVVGVVSEPLPTFSARGWAIVLWLAVVNTAVAFTLWNHTLRRLTAVESSMVNNTMLVQIAALAWIFLGEGLGGRQIAGLALAVVGILAVQLAPLRHNQPEPDSGPNSEADETSTEGAS
jgi:drug/metabolite transporter (DMT)-like permease